MYVFVFMLMYFNEKAVEKERVSLMQVVMQIMMEKVRYLMLTFVSILARHIKSFNLFILNGKV